MVTLAFCIKFRSWIWIERSVSLPGQPCPPATPVPFLLGNNVAGYLCMLSEILCLLFHLMYLGGYIPSQNIQTCLFFSLKLRYNSHTIKCTTLMYSPLAFNICTKLCICYHNQIPEHLEDWVWVFSSYL